jgi:putative NIF3 family GTP cyclohydrolase 1 type 2
VKLKKIYELIVREGMNADPRGKILVQETLKKRRAEFQSLAAAQKEFFDKEALENPYDDTRLLHGDPDAEIKTALVGIDIDGSELLAIDRLNGRGKKKIDLAIAHHPQGRALAHLADVMEMQADLFHLAGVPINIAEGLVDDRMREVHRRLHAANHQRAVDMARLLDIPFLCMHTPADNHVASFLGDLFTKKHPQTLKDVLDILKGIEEYRISSREQISPAALFGKPSNRCGKIMVDMTGGTEGPRDIFDNLAQAGVGTLVCMHLSEEHYKKLQGKHTNVVIAGHIASDNLGMNLLLDKIERATKINVLSTSGFRRVKR